MQCKAQQLHSSHALLRSCMRFADPVACSRPLHRNCGTLARHLREQGARARRFERFSRRAAYRREALHEPRMMRRRAHACGARIVRAFHASPTFHGSELVIWAMYSTLSVCALCMSVSKWCPPFVVLQTKTFPLTCQTLYAKLHLAVLYVKNI